MTEKRSISLRYRASIGKWEIRSETFDSLDDLATAVAELNLHLVRDILRKVD